jgi:hypothetical protein
MIKDYHDSNVVNTWENLKNKNEPVSAPSMVKLDKHFSDSTVKKGQDPKCWFTKLEEILVRLDYMAQAYQKINS